MDLSSPTAPAPGVLDLGVNWLDTGSFPELWFGQAKGRRGSVALCRCSGSGNIRAGSKERGLLARGHGDPGLRLSSAWPMEEGLPPSLGSSFVYGTLDMGALPFWSLIAPSRGQDRAGQPTGPLPWDPWPKYQQGRTDLVCRNDLAAGALAGGLWAQGRRWWAAGSVAAWEAPSPWVLAGPPTGPQVLSKPSPSPRQAAKLLPQPQSPLETFYCQMFCFFHRTRGQHEVAGGRLTPPDLQPGPVSQPVLQTLHLPSQPTQGK